MASAVVDWGALGGALMFNARITESTWVEIEFLKSSLSFSIEVKTLEVK